MGECLKSSLTVHFNDKLNGVAIGGAIMLHSNKVCDVLYTIKKARYPQDKVNVRIIEYTERLNQVWPSCEIITATWFVEIGLGSWKPQIVSIFMQLLRIRLSISSFCKQNYTITMRVTSLLASALISSIILAIPLRSTVQSRTDSHKVADGTAIQDGHETQTPAAHQDQTIHTFQGKDLKRLEDVAIMMVKGYSLIQEGVEKGRWDADAVKKAFDGSVQKLPDFTLHHDEMERKFEEEELDQLEGIMDMIIGGYGTIAEGIQDNKWNKEYADAAFDKIFPLPHFTADSASVNHADRDEHRIAKRVDGDLENDSRLIIHHKELILLVPEQIKFLHEQLHPDISGMPIPDVSQAERPKPQNPNPEETKFEASTTEKPKFEKWKTKESQPEDQKVEEQMTVEQKLNAEKAKGPKPEQTEFKEEPEQIQAASPRQEDGNFSETESERLVKALEALQNTDSFDAESAKAIASKLPTEVLNAAHEKVEADTKRRKEEDALIWRAKVRNEKTRRDQKEIERLNEEMAEVRKHIFDGQAPPDNEPVWIAKPPPPSVPKTPEQIAEEEERKKNEPPKHSPTQRESLPPPVYAGLLPEKFAIGAAQIAAKGQVHNTEEERRARHKTCPKCWGP